MGGIPDEQVEWAVVNRLRAMMLDPPVTPFNVTQTFALFTTIVLWTKNRAWVGGNNPSPERFGATDRAAHVARQRLESVKIMDAPWCLARRAPRNVVTYDMQALGESPINSDFIDMSAEAFVKWLRDALAHGDGRTVRPLHKPSLQSDRVWLAGMCICFEESRSSSRKLTLSLYEADMKRMGVKLADLFCESLAGGRGYHQMDAATAIVDEVAA